MSQTKRAQYYSQYKIAVTLGYATFGLLWIFVSDNLVNFFIDANQIVWFSMAKGVLFVGITSLLLYLALSHHPAENAQQTLAVSLFGQKSAGHWPRWFYYAFAIAISLLVLFIRLSLPIPVEAKSLAILFMLPIVLSAALGGLGPGVVSTIVSTLSLAYFVMLPVNTFALASSTDLLQLGLLVVNGLLVSTLSKMLYDTLHRIEAARQLQAITLASAGDAIITTDKHCKVLTLNPAAESLTGWREDQALGLPVRDMLNIHNADGSSFKSDLFQATLGAHTPIKFDSDSSLRNRNGDEFFVNITSAPIRLSDEKPLGIILTIQDNTQKLHLNHSLQEQSKLFQEMSALASIGAWEYNPQTEASTWTEEVARIFELPPQLHVDNELVFGSGFWAPEQEAELRTAMCDAVDHATAYALEMPMRTAKGNQRWVRISANPVIQNGRTVKLRGSIQDISLRKRVELALRDKEASYARIIAGSDQGFWEFNVRTHNITVSARYLSMLGYPENRQSLTLAEWRQHIHPDDRPKTASALEKHIAGLSPILELDFRAYTVQGKLIWLHTRGKIVEWDENKQPVLVAGAHTDITARKLAEDALRKAAVVFETTQESVIITDAETRITQVNRAFTQLTGYTEAEVLGQKPKLLSSGRNSPETYTEMWRDIENMGYWQGELWNRRKNGEVFPVLISINVARDNSGQVTNYVSVFMDISKSKASEERLEYLAHHDPLTNLPNRLLMFSQLEHALAKIHRTGGSLALLMFDLDRFKDVNDSFGHMAGDNLLQMVAKRLSARLRGSDSFARLGGDEFTVLLQDMARPEDAARVAEDIIDALNMPFTLALGIEIRIGASVGISLSTGMTGAETLMQQADAAMYRAKDEGRGCFQFYSESMTHAARERISLDARLRRALEREELCVHYQPQVDMASGRIIGAEALVRWISPEEGLVPPGRFIPVAEETGLIIQIGEWVLQEACRQGRKWLDDGFPPLALAVNVSARQIRNGTFSRTIDQVLAETRFPAHLLELELTESILMDVKSGITTQLEEFRSRQIMLAIDDFGIGYSSLSYLKTFPLDVLKIDKSFVDDISHDQGDRMIIKAIIEMGHTLGIKVLAEGVESEEQLTFLQDKGCDLYQGYLYSKPLPADEFELLLRGKQSF